MPYRKSLACIDERKEELDLILASVGKIVTFKTNEPARLRYRLHEAFDAARHLGIAPYKTMWRDYEILLKAPFVHVRERVIHNIKVQEVYLDEQTVVLPASDIRVFDEAVSEFDVAGILIANPDARELHFPSFGGNVSSVQALADAKGYSIVDSSVLVLRKGEPDVHDS